MAGREDKTHDYASQPSSSGQKRKKKNGDQSPQVPAKKKAYHKDGSPMEDATTYFYYIKENVGSGWRDLAFHLGFGQTDINTIANSDGNRNDKSRCMNLLGEWHQRNGDKATIEALMKALSKAKLKSTVDGLKNMAHETAAQSQPVRANHQQTATIKPPDGLKVVETGNYRIKLRWDPVDSDQLFGYCVEKSIVLPNPAFQKWDSTHESLAVLPVQPTELEVGSLKPYKEYNFQVKSAINMEGKLLFGKGSTPQYVVTRKQYQPWPPRYVMVTHGITPESVSLMWTQPLPAPDVDPARYKYVIETCCHAVGRVRRKWTECCRTSEQTCTVKVGHSSGDYFFQVSTIIMEDPETVSMRSLPEEMEDPKIPIHIEAKSGWFGPLLSSLKACWPFPATEATSQEGGSIVFVISCLDLDGLRELWMNYNLGNVKTFFQDLFALASKVSDTELDIKIDQQDFYACRRHLLLTCPVDGGRRVVRLGDASSRAGTQRGLSEDYPVYCKPISHKTTCSQLDFLDLAVSTRQPTAVEKVKVQPKQLSADEEPVRLAAVKTGLDRTTSVDNLLVLTPPTRQVGSSNLRGLDLAMVSREEQCSKGLTDESSTLKFTVRQVQTALQTRRVKVQEQLKGLYQSARQDSEAMVRSLSKEVTMLKQKDEKAQKILLEHKEEIRQLQDTNKNKEAKIEELASENTKLANQLPNLHDEVRSLREKDKTSQKVLLEKEQEIQNLQDTNKDMATKLQDLLSAKHALEGKSEGASSGKEKDSSRSRKGKDDIDASLAAVLLVNDVYGPSEREFSIKRQVVETLREYEPDVPVFSTVLQATEEDMHDAQQDGVELLLPKLDPDDPRTDPSLDWLTFDHGLKYPYIPSKVRTLLGHTGVTGRATVRIKQERYPHAKVILITNDIPEDTECYKGVEKAMGFGKKEDSILKDVQEADVVFSLGNKIFDHFEHQFKAIPAYKRPRHFKFVPRPSKIFADAEAEYKDTETMVVVSICRVTGVEELMGLDFAVEALSIVAEKMKVKLRVIGVNKDDIQTSKAILEHCKSGILQITLLPYGTQKDICKEMMQAHLVLMPSRAEPFGLVGLEAIAAGVPVLVSSRSGLADFIHEYVDELHHSIVDMDGRDEHANVRRWANAIERALKHNRTEFKTAARCKQQLLSTKYWEESHQQFIKACIGEAVVGRMQYPAMAGHSKEEQTQVMTGKRSAAHLGEMDESRVALKLKTGPFLHPVLVEILAQVRQSVKTPDDMISYTTAKEALCTMDITADDAHELLQRVKFEVKSIPDLLRMVTAIETLEKLKGVEILDVQEG